jgi:hypothetical protein
MVASVDPWVLKSAMMPTKLFNISISWSRRSAGLCTVKIQ